LEPDELYLSLGLAIAAGLLIGIERELSAPRASADGSFLGGARTHPLVALVAGLSVLLSRETGWPVVVAAFASLILFLVVNFFDDVRRGAERGLTSETAFLVSFLLGALALTRDVIRPPEHKFLAVAGRRGGRDGAALGEAGAEPVRPAPLAPGHGRDAEVPHPGGRHPAAPARPRVRPLRSAQPAADRGLSR